MSLWDDIGHFLSTAGGDVGHALGFGNATPQAQAKPQAPPIARPQQIQPQFRTQPIPTVNPQIQQAQQGAQADALAQSLQKQKQQQQAIQGMTPNAGSMNTTLKQIAAPVVGLGKALGGAAVNVGAAPDHTAIGLGAEAVGAKGEARNQFGQARKGLTSVRQLAQGIPQMAVQLGESVNPAGGVVQNRQFQPKGAVQKFLLGNQPIPSIQKQYDVAKQQKGSAYAASQAGLTALMDASGLYGVGKSGVALAKNAADNIKPPMPTKGNKLVLLVGEK